MKLKRTSVGLAVRAAREAAGLTLKDLAGMTGLTLSSLSRSETGDRDIAFTEVLAIAEALKVDADTLRTLAETFERAGATEKRKQLEGLAQDLNDLQRVAIEAAIEARALHRAA
jgi:transcriptional regulator with XRE-family HTH domain